MRAVIGGVVDRGGGGEQGGGNKDDMRKNRSCNIGRR